jgi:ribonucleoside-triphosphate reductase
MSNEGQEFAIMILETLNTVNDRLQKQYEAPHNVEQVPGESLSVKLASKDKLFRIQDKYDFYSNQFIPLICKADLLDRITLQGLFDSHFSGGAIAHLNVEQRIEDYNIVKKLIRSAVKKGVIYFAVNYTLQRCAKSHMSVGRGDKCYCGADIIETYQRVVGFLTATRTWNKTRRELDEPNRVFYKNSDIKF